MQLISCRMGGGSGEKQRSRLLVSPPFSSRATSDEYRAFDEALSGGRCLQDLVSSCARLSSGVWPPVDCANRLGWG